MEKQGFIKLSPNFVDWEWFSDSNTLSLFLYLLLSASPVDTTFFGNVVQRGQLMTTLRRIKDGTGISIQSLRTCLKRLERSGVIKVKTTNKYSIITVCDFDKYCD